MPGTPGFDTPGAPCAPLIPAPPPPPGGEGAGGSDRPRARARGCCAWRARARARSAAEDGRVVRSGQHPTETRRAARPAREERGELAGARPGQATRRRGRWSGGRGGEEWEQRWGLRGGGGASPWAPGAPCAQLAPDTPDTPSTWQRHGDSEAQLAGRVDLPPGTPIIRPPRILLHARPAKSRGFAWRRPGAAGLRGSAAGPSPEPETRPAARTPVRSPRCRAERLQPVSLLGRAGSAPGGGQGRARRARKYIRSIPPLPASMVVCCLVTAWSSAARRRANERTNVWRCCHWCFGNRLLAYSISSGKCALLMFSSRGLCSLCILNEMHELFCRVLSLSTMVQRRSRRRTRRLPRSSLSPKKSSLFTVPPFHCSLSALRHRLSQRSLRLKKIAGIRLLWPSCIHLPASLS